MSYSLIFGTDLALAVLTAAGAVLAAWGLPVGPPYARAVGGARDLAYEGVSTRYRIGPETPNQPE
jgi:hypothetical protein